MPLHRPANQYRGEGSRGTSGGTSGRGKGGIHHTGATIATVRRILLVVNVLIAIAVIAAGGIFYWIFHRSLPRTSGTIETRVSQPVEVSRDSLGVPHIKAKTLEDALFVEGYVTAEDRMWQMDTLRRLPAGELSEIIGVATLESDREARRLRLRRIAEQIYMGLSAADKSSFSAYARGINSYIESHHGRYGMEFRLLGYDPRPWSVVDSILVGLHMFRTLTSDWRTKLIKDQMLRGGEPDKVNFLFPVRSGAEFAPGADIHPGSNAWAVSGAHSASGKPLLSNDMHLEFSLPGVWYMAHLECPGMNVEGVELPGVPGIVAGHNDHIAWGVTNLGFDVQELYLEKIDLLSGRYLFAGKVEQARQEREFISVKGRATEELQLWVTRHGPIFQQMDNKALALHWTAADPAIFHNVFLDIDRARNWEQFKAAIAQFGGPGQNFVYTDTDGNIGYHAAGKLPIRRNFYGDVPVDGSTGENEWDGYIPFDQLPQAYNPQNGFLVTANQNPFPPDFPWHVGGTFASQHRSRQILDMLKASGNKLTPDDNLRIETDVYSGFSKFLARQLVAAYEKRGATNPQFTDAVRMLRTWDGQMDRDHAEPFIVTLVFQDIRKAIAERASPGGGALYETQISTSVVERLLKERPAGWFSDYNELLLRCFADGMEEGQRIQGGDPGRWKWGRYMFLDGKNPIGSQIPFVGKPFNIGPVPIQIPFVGSYFNIGPVPMSGWSTTVKQTSRKLIPSERMTISTGKWDESLWSLPVGESGNVASFHYRDQWDAFYTGRGFPMQFGKIDVKSSVVFVPAK
jgi:penicillin amidase